MLLTEMFPSLAIELEQLLRDKREEELAAQVSQLVIVDRCRCGDDFCSSFYTQPKPNGSYRPNHRTVLLDAVEGMLILDAVAGKIAYVEILNRSDIRPQLMASLP